VNKDDHNAPVCQVVIQSRKAWQIY